MGSEENNVELEAIVVENTGERSDKLVENVNESQAHLSKQYAEALVRLRREKRTRKTKVTKLKHHLQKLCNLRDGDNTAEIENYVNELWEVLEETQLVMDEMSSLYLQMNEMKMHEGITQESDNLQGEIQQVIDNAQNVLIAPNSSRPNLTPGYQAPSPDTQFPTTTDQTATLAQPIPLQQPPNPIQQTVTPGYHPSNHDIQPITTTDQAATLSQPIPLQRPPNPIQQTLTPGYHASNQDTQPLTATDPTATLVQPAQVLRPSSPSSYQAPTLPQMQNRNSIINRHLKPLRVPDFDGNKSKFEEFWEIFVSLVDASNEPVNLKMARLQQCLTGRARDAIRGLGVSIPEYEEAIEILKTKFGGRRRQLRAYLEELENWPVLRHSDVDGFEKFADLVRVTMVKLKAENRHTELGEGALHSQLVKKLPGQQLESYSRWLNVHKEAPAVTSLCNWLKEEVAIKVEAKEMSHGLDEKSSQERRFNRGRHNDGRPRSYFTGAEGGGRHPNRADGQEERPRKKPPCSLCGQSNHGIWNCNQFKQKTVGERWNIAKEQHLCFRCLSNEHRGKDCKRSRRCEVGGCQLTHHRLLHDTESGRKLGPVLPDEVAETPREGANGVAHFTMTSCRVKTQPEAFSLRTVPVWVKARGKKLKVNAVLDDASNESFMNEEVAGLLGMATMWQTVEVQVLNDSVETFKSMPLEVEIESDNRQFTKTIQVQTCPRAVTGSYRVVDWNLYQKNWPHLAQCNFPTPAKGCFADLLIGVDNPELHASLVDFQGPSGGPVARLGPLGWTCIGPPMNNVECPTRSHCSSTLFTKSRCQEIESSECCSLDRTLRNFWEIETTGTEKPRVLTEDEKTALQLVESSLKVVDERYQISVPWKNGRPKLPNNRHMAASRLASTEKNLLRKPGVADEYQKTIDAYLEKGYLRKVDPEKEETTLAWYLPHFPVVRMDKSSTKVRIVFDCSAKCEGVSLNDMIHTGPKLQKDLFDVLIRFRRNPVALACDIREMYLQIATDEKDRSYFRMFWRNVDTESEPTVYEFSRVVFGKNSAPMESQYVAQENARRYQHLYPLAAETVLESTYMDDSIDSVEDDKDGVQLYHELKELWAKAKMEARKWVSNSPQVLAEIPVEDRASEIVINDGQNPTTKTLGIAWNSQTDEFGISICETSRLQLTKRNVLRKIATIFDPLVFVSPFIVIAKILLQELWTRGYGWDEEIKDDIAQRLTKWFEQLGQLNAVKIPRCLRAEKPVVSTRIITFVDSSKEAYGCAVYVRHEYENQQVTCRLVTSKSKVAPLTPVTIPKLELMGAVLGL